MEKILRRYQPFSLIEVLKGLIESAHILLHKKDYDGHGWEGLELCYRHGKDILLELESKPIGWINVEMLKPEFKVLDSTQVLAYTGQNCHVCTYITDENGIGRFYIDMAFPKAIFEDITNDVTHWAYIDKPYID